MRVLLAAGLAAASMLAGLSGCSSMKMPSFLTAKNKTKQSSTEMANAPGPPGTYGSIASPESAAGSTAGWSNLPVYPGTNYPQTPYPEHNVSGGPPAYAGYQAMPAQPQAAPTNPYVPGYGTTPPTVAMSTANPYTPSAATAPAPAYAPGSTAPYAGQGAYATSTPQGAASYAQGGPYPQQQAAPTPQPAPYTNPYAQQSPTGGPADPYGTTEPHNAANPYGTYTR